MQKLPNVRDEVVDRYGFERSPLRIIRLVRSVLHPVEVRLEVHLIHENCSEFGDHEDSVVFFCIIL